jgi:uncharacterized membrane protein
MLPIVLPVVVVVLASTVAFAVTWAYTDTTAAVTTTDATTEPDMTDMTDRSDTTTIVDIEPDPVFVVIEPAIVTPGHVPAATEARHDPEDPIDYSRLNTNVRVVADTLERFNQKLLRMIAQARAEQIRAEAAALGTWPVEPEDEDVIEDEADDGIVNPAPVAIPAAANQVIPADSEPTL